MPDNESRVRLPQVRRKPGRPPKHGAYDGAELAILTPAKRDEIIEVLSGERPAIGKTDQHAVTLLAKALAKIELFDRYFAACGLIDENDRMREGPMKVYLATINAAARLLDMLGMTPQARVRLGIGLIQADKDLSSMMRDAQMEEPE